MKRVHVKKEQIERGRLILINREHALTQQKIDLSLVTGGEEDVFLEKEAAAVLERIFEHLNLDSEIVPVSGFRSRTTQEKLYKESDRVHGSAYTKKFVALPGCSEHESGLAIDLSLFSEEMDLICPKFPYKGVAQQFREAAPYFGYIERYMKDKQGITGIGHEPWHFRYVGYPHSLIMKELHLSMEEYIGMLRTTHGEDNPYVYGAQKDRVRIFYRKIEEDMSFTVAEDEFVHVSGDNIDGCIITIEGGSYEN